MGLKIIAGLALLSGCLFAQPRLRLSSTTVGPVSVTAGAANTSSVIEAFNSGTGTLNLTATANATWLSPQVGPSRSCTTRTGSCIPITMAITAPAAAGVQTAVVTVSDPAAWDAPQTITVTIQVGGGIPDSIQLFVPPAGRAERTLTPASPTTPVASTTSGGPWLSVIGEGSGTISFSRVFRVVAQAAGQAEGNYDGTVRVANSTFAAENKTVPVRMTVTSQPIVEAAPDRLILRWAQGSGAQKSYVTLSNRGRGALSIASASVTGITGVTAAPLPGTALVEVSVNTDTIAPGTYRGAVAASGPWANGSVTVPVVLDIVSQGPPQISFGGVLNNANFAANEPLGLGGLAVLFGSQFYFKAPLVDARWPAGVDGVGVFVNGVAAPLYYVSYGQINFQIPYSVTPGPANVTVVRNGVVGNVATFELRTAVSRIMEWGSTGYAIAVNNNGTLPLPAALAIPGFTARAAAPGDFLVFYCLGLGPTTPAVASGAPAPGAEPFARVAGNIAVEFGDVTPFSPAIPAAPVFVGLTPGFVGLYQVNVQIPQDSPRNPAVPVRLSINGTRSTAVRIAIQ
jgi:uncharacterized protein (TIGR03437 family)